MLHLNWERSTTQKLAHEKDLLDQYIAYHRSKGKVKPKKIVGKKYRTTYPELYKLTNPKAAEWNPNPEHVKSREFVPKEKKKEE